MVSKALRLLAGILLRHAKLSENCKSVKGYELDQRSVELRRSRLEELPAQENHPSSLPGVHIIDCSDFMINSIRMNRNANTPGGSGSAELRCADSYKVERTQLGLVCMHMA